MTRVPLDSPAWPWTARQAEWATHGGRRCIRFGESANLVASPAGIELTDGTVELDLAVDRHRSFHGLTWRQRGTTYESFFVRPHQVGNPDAVQYTPVFNDVSAWQLYHGPGYWAPVSFPIERWFRLRVAFAGTRGEAYIDDMDQPALVFGRLKVPVSAGLIGIMVGGPGLHVARFAYDDRSPVLRGAAPRQRRLPGSIPGWWVSDPFTESVALTGKRVDELFNGRSWTRLESEPSGLANLARVQPLIGRRNTVLVRTTIRCEEPAERALEIGFSDRAKVFLNGRPLFGGNDTYRTRDYRFLGSIGLWDTLYLPLLAGDNELVMAVSETFGGWGVMARFPDPTGISFTG